MSKRRMPHNIILIIGFFSIFVSGSMYAQNMEEQSTEVVKRNRSIIESSDSISNLWLNVNFGYVLIERDERLLKGIDVIFGLGVALSNSLIIGGGIKQAYKTEFANFTSLYVAFDLYAEWALTGKFASKNSIVRANGITLYESKEVPGSGWRLAAFLDQFFFNTLTAAFPFSGFGVSVYYQFHMPFVDGLKIGARFDRIVNRDVTLMPMTVFTGFSFLL